LGLIGKKVQEKFGFIGHAVNLLILSDVFRGMGGAERHICLLVHELRLNNINVVVIALRGGPLLKRLHMSGIKVFDLQLDKIFSKNGLLALRKISEIIRLESISAILTYHEGSDFLGALAGLISGVPVVSSRRDMGFKLKQRHIWIYRCITPFIHQIVAVSDAVKRRVMSSQWVGSSKISVIHNGVNSEFLNDNSFSFYNDLNCSERYGVLKNEILVCCLSNLRPLIKGHDSFNRKCCFGIARVTKC